MSEKQGVILEWFKDQAITNKGVYFKPCEVQRSLSRAGRPFTSLYVWRACTQLAKTSYLEVKQGNGSARWWDNALRFRAKPVTKKRLVTHK